MNRLLAIVAVLVLSASANAHCGAPGCLAARAASIPAQVSVRLAQSLRPVAVAVARPVVKVNVLRRAPVRNAVAGLLFRPYR